MNKEIKRIVRRIKQNGWDVKQGRKHFKARAPKTGKIVVFSVTPSCGHAIKNIEKDLQRAEEKENV